MSQKAGVDLSSLFDQYLRHTQIPKLVINFESKKVTYQFEECNKDLSFPLKLNIDGQATWITPTTTKQTLETAADIKELSVDRNFYLRSSVNGVPTNKPKHEGTAEKVK